ncbi:MAG: ABC transporter substrate-binding protein [Acetanaerobacterium sp.]
MRRWGCMLLVLVLCLCGCAREKNTLRLGVNLELTGRLAWYGEATLSGIELAVAEINRAGGVSGKSVELLVLDNRSENAEAALAAIKLAQRGRVLAIIGPSTSGGVKASLAAGCGVPILVPSATADTLVPQNAAQNEMFRICYTDTMQGGAMARFAVQQGYARAALLIEASSDYARGMSDAFAQTFEDMGGSIAVREYYTGGETDFGGVIARLGAQPYDVLFLPAYYTEAALIIRQLSEQGVHTPILSGDAFDSPTLDELVGSAGALSDIYYSNHYTPDGGECSGFEKRYDDAYGEPPPAYAALGYDCAWLFALALQQTEGKTSSELFGQLAHTLEFEGVTGSITIDENHNACKPVHIIRIQNGVRQGVDVIEDAGTITDPSDVGGEALRPARRFVRRSAGEVRDALA